MSPLKDFKVQLPSQKREEEAVNLFNAEKDLRGLLQNRKKTTNKPKEEDRVADFITKDRVLTALETRIEEYQLTEMQIERDKYELDIPKTTDTDDFGSEYIPEIDFSNISMEVSHIYDDGSHYSIDELKLLNMSLFRRYKKQLLIRHKNMKNGDSHIRDRVIQGELASEIPKVLEIARELMILNYFMSIVALGATFDKNSFVNFVLSARDGKIFRKSECEKALGSIHTQTGGCKIMFNKTKKMRDQIRELLVQIGAMPKDVLSAYDDSIADKKGNFYAIEAIGNIWDLAEKNKDEFLEKEMEEILGSIAKVSS